MNQVRAVLPSQTIPPLSFSFSSDGPSLTLPFFVRPRFFPMENLLQRVETALRHPRERGKANAALHPRSFQIAREETPLSRAQVLGSCDGSFPFVSQRKGISFPFDWKALSNRKGKGRSGGIVVGNSCTDDDGDAMGYGGTFGELAGAWRLLHEVRTWYTHHGRTTCLRV